MATVKIAAWEQPDQTTIPRDPRTSSTTSTTVLAQSVSADGVSGLGRGSLGGLAEDVLQGIDRLDQAAYRPPAMGTLGRAAEHHEAITELRSSPAPRPSNPAVQQLVHVPESMVPGPRTPWTKVTEGFAPNTEYRVPGRGTFITDANGTITEAVITKVKDTLNPT